jgi:hypothetical protein
MKKTIRLTESDLVRLVKRVIKEQGDLNIEFDPTKKVPSEPKKGQSINPNKDAFEKVKAELMAIKKPSRLDEYEYEGEKFSDVVYTDSVWVQGKGALDTYRYVIGDAGTAYFDANTPEMVKLAEEAGFEKFHRVFNSKHQREEVSFRLFWNTGDLNANIQKMKNLLRNPKLRVSYDYKLQ